MTYNLIIEKKAMKFIKSQPRFQQYNILNAIKQLPTIGDVKLLINHKDVFRLRVGGYRIIFTVKDDILLITVADAGNRGQIYNSW